MYLILYTSSCVQSIGEGFIELLLCVKQIESVMLSDQ